MTGSTEDFEEFQALVRRAIDLLPEEFRRGLTNVAIQAVEEPDPALVAEWEIEDPEELLGFHTGYSHGGQAESFTGMEPDRIFVFRRACEAEAAETGFTLEEVVRQTLFHEAGHYFGLSEEEMDEIEEQWQQKEKGSGLEM